MRVSCGTDIIENRRIQEAIIKNKRFIEKNYSAKEIEYCLSKKAQKYESFAARFAGKEAVAKALGLGFGKDISFIDIEILNNQNKKPLVNLSEKVKTLFPTLKEISISLSHVKEYSIAYVIITFEEE